MGKASHSESDHIGSIPAGCWYFCRPLVILRGSERPVSGLTRALIYCCALYTFYFLGFHQWQSRAERILTLDIWTSNFHHFGALGVGPGARTQPYVRAWRMGSDHSYCLASKQFRLKRPGHCCFPLNYLKYWKKVAHCAPRWGFFNPGPLDCIVRETREDRESFLHK